MTTGGELIRRARVDGGLTQETLAQRAELSTRTIRALESAPHVSPRRESVERVAAALHLRLEDRRTLLSAWGFDIDREPLAIESLWDPTGRYADVVELLRDQFADVHPIVVIRSARVNHRGEILVERQQRVIRADRDGVSTVIAVLGGLNPRVLEVAVTDTEGVRVARAIHPAGADWFAFQLSLPRPLRRGDIYSYSMDQHLRYDRTADSAPIAEMVGDALREPASVYVARVAFDGPVPDCYQVYRLTIDSPLQRIRPLPTQGASGAQIVIEEPSAGWHGIAWDAPN